MFVVYALKGILSGFIVSAPVGPLALLCIRNTVTYGALAGILTGIGIALGDTLLVGIAASGVHAAAAFMNKYYTIVKVLGSLLLLFIAYKEFFKTPTKDTSTLAQNKMWKIPLQAFFLTLANPMVLVLFGGVFASIAPESVHFFTSVIIVFSIGSGSLLWWLILSMITQKTRGNLSLTFLKRVQVISSLILAGVGVYGIMSIFMPHLQNLMKL